MPMGKVPSFMRSSTGLGTTPRVTRPEGVPLEFLLRDLKQKRKFRMLSRKLTLFVTFVGFYVATLLLDRNISGRAIVRSIVSNELLGPSNPSGMAFNDIRSADALYRWLGDSLISTVYASTPAGSGNATDAELKYTIASHTVIVGGFHLLQTRYKALNFSSQSNAGTRCYSTLEPLQNRTCLLASVEADEPFGVSSGTLEDMMELEELEMFSFSLSNDSQGGYQTYFLRSSTGGADERARLAKMQTHGWLDARTKSVAVTMPLFNYNLQLWSIVHLTVEFDLAGGVTPTADILVIDLDPYNFDVTSNIVRAIFEGIFVAHVAYFILLELWDTCVVSGGSMSNYMARYGLVNNIGDWANILVNLAIVLWRYLSQNAPPLRKLLALASFDEYVEASGLFDWDQALLGLNLFNMLLMTARALKYFQVTNGGRRLMSSVYGAMPEVLSFLPIYVSVIIGYTFAGHMIYGLRYPEWSTFPRAFFRVFELNFGLYDPGPIYDDNGVFSAVFIYSSSVVFCILMLNVFMAIVMSTWDRLTEREAERAAERAEFSTPLGVSDTLFLISSSEDFIDTLIEAAMDLEPLLPPDDATVTRAAFLQSWKDTDLGDDVSERTRARVLSWYWDATAAAKAAGAKAAKTSPSALVRPGSPSSRAKPPRLASIADARTLEERVAEARDGDDDGDGDDADATVINSPRELDGDALRAKPVDKKRSGVGVGIGVGIGAGAGAGPWTKPTGSYRVAATDARR